MHVSGIATGFISSLGLGCVTVFCEAIAEDENSFGLVADNKTGFLVPLGGKDLFLGKIIELANNSELREKFGQGGKERVIKSFNDVKIAEFLDDFYLCNAIVDEDDSYETCNFN